MATGAAATGWGPVVPPATTKKPATPSTDLGTGELLGSPTPALDGWGPVTPPPPPAPSFFEQAVVNPLKSVGAGFYQGAAGAGHLIKNTANLADKALEVAAGPGQNPAIGLLRKPVQAISEGGAQMQRFYGENAGALRGTRDDLASKVYEGIGQAPVEIGKYMLGGHILGGMTRGMAAIDALGAVDQGPQATTIAGAKGALLGRGLHMISPTTIPIRVGASGTMFGLDAAASGGDATDIASAAIVGGGLGIMGGPGKRLKDIYRDPRKPLFNIESEAPKPVPEVKPSPSIIPPRGPAATTPASKPPIPQPTGLDALHRAESQLGPVASTIPDRLLGVTPYQRHLDATLGPAQSALLPSRLTEAQRVHTPIPEQPLPPTLPPRARPGPVAERPVGPPVGEPLPPRPAPQQGPMPSPREVSSELAQFQAETAAQRNLPMRSGRPVVRKPGETGMVTPDALTGGLGERIAREDPTAPFDPSRPAEERLRSRPRPLELQPPEGRKEVVQPALPVTPRAPETAIVAPPPARESARPPIDQAIRREFESTPGWSDSAPATLPQVLDRLESQGYSRKEASDAILRLADSQEIYLTTHDHGPALPAADRAKLLHDPLSKDAKGRDAYYVAASAREWGAPISPSRRATQSGMATPEFLSLGVTTAKDKIISESKEFADLATTAATNTKEFIHGMVNHLAPRLQTDQRTQDTIFKEKGKRQREMEAHSVALEGMRKQVAVLPADQQIAIIDRMMRGEAQPTPELQTISDVVKQSTDKLFDLASKHAPFIKYMENYGVGITWKKAPKHPEWDPKSGLPRDVASLQGGAGFLKHRFWQSLSKGIEYGGEPISTNVIDLLGSNVAHVQKFVTAQNMFQSLKESGQVQWVEGYKTKPPEGYSRFNVDVAQHYFTPEGKKTYAGGYWAIADGPAGMLRNYLSRDAWRDLHSASTPAEQSIAHVGRTIMGIKNAYTLYELGFSFFHPMFVTAEAQLSYLGTAMRRATNLRTGTEGLQALKETLLAASPGGAAGESFAIGRKSKQLFGEVAKAERGLSDAKSVEDIRALPQFKRLFKRFPEAIEYLDDFFTGGGTLGLHSDYQVGFLNALKDTLAQGRIGASTKNLILGIPEIISGPLFRHYIPALKLGTFMREYSLALQENSARMEKGEVTREELARKTVEFVEDRFGEMNFENLFWNKTFKTSTQMGFRSVTWILGNTRSMFTALPQQGKYTYDRVVGGNHEMPPLSPKGAWILGMAIFNAALGSLTQYALTGKLPEEPKDLIYPRYDANDPTARLVLPTSIKEAQAFLLHPAKRLRGGLSGVWAKSRDVIANRDFMGTQVYNPDDTLIDKAKDIGGHLFPAPISISSFQQAKESGGSDVEKWGSAFGFLKAPRYIVDDAATTQLRDENNARGLSITRTKDEAARSRYIAGVARSLVAGRDEQARGLFKEGVDKGVLSPDDLDKVLDRAETTGDPDAALVAGVKRLPIPSALNVWAKATPTQQALLRPEIEKKLEEAIDSLPEAQLQSIERKLRDVGWIP
jgi:hypothetical protein